MFQVVLECKSRNISLQKFTIDKNPVLVYESLQHTKL